jgi:hypothetical protein
LRSTSSAIWQETSRLISVPPSLGRSGRSPAPSDQSQLVTSPRLETQRRHEARAPVVSSVCTNTHVRMKALFCTRPRSYRRAAPFLRFHFVFSCIPAMLACSQACFAWIRVQTLDRAFVPAVLLWRAPRPDRGERLLLVALMGWLDGLVPFMDALDFMAAFGVPDIGEWDAWLGPVYDVLPCAVCRGPPCQFSDAWSFRNVSEYGICQTCQDSWQRATGTGQGPSGTGQLCAHLSNIASQEH